MNIDKFCIVLLFSQLTEPKTVGVTTNTTTTVLDIPIREVGGMHLLAKNSH
uniref:hypothetical protein n=1 Tax=Bacillus cereus TaxID=1396 RepID=UPI00312B2D4B